MRKCLRYLPHFAIDEFVLADDSVYFEYHPNPIDTNVQLNTLV